MLKRNAPSLLAALSMLFAGACGSSSGPSTNLKPVFFRTVSTAPVATLTLQRQSGAPLAQAQARFDTRTLFDGWAMVGRTTTATANTSGVAALALPAGTYPVRIDSRVSQNTALIGLLNDTLAISADTNRTYRTSQQSWTVTTPVAVSALRIAIYQVDGAGKALVGTDAQPLEPRVLSATVPAPNGNATAVPFSTELFKGSYRALITATPVTSTDSIAPFETDVFNAAGDGATETQALTMISGGNVVSLQFLDNGAAVPDTEIGGVTVFDANSLIRLGSAGSVNGVATVATGSVASVLAVVQSKDGATVAASTYTAAPNHSATLTRYNVTGHAKAPGSTQLTANGTNDYGTMTATLQSGLPAYWQEQVSPVAATITDALGTYTMKLFAGNWSLQATQLKNLPVSASVALTVSTADVPAQDIALDAGGVVTGNIQDQAHANLSGVSVVVLDAAHNLVGHANTDTSGNYSIPVPFGTYEVFANGALTRDVSVSSGAATRSLNLTRFQISGRLTDATQGPVPGTVVWAGGSATATTLGTYTVNVIEGVNWFMMSPPSTLPSLGFAYENNVLVNADTVKSLQ